MTIHQALKGFPGTSQVSLYKSNKINLPIFWQFWPGAEKWQLLSTLSVNVLYLTASRLLLMFVYMTSITQGLYFSFHILLTNLFIPCIARSKHCLSHPLALKWDIIACWLFDVRTWQSENLSEHPQIVFLLENLMTQSDCQVLYHVCLKQRIYLCKWSRLYRCGQITWRVDDVTIIGN
jgi:hypothetical protein